MTLHVIHAGVQSSIQAGPYRGSRGRAMPSAGAADPLSLALANRLVGKAETDAAIEITLTAFELSFECETSIALAGAAPNMVLNGRAAPAHSVLSVRRGDIAKIPSVSMGCRSYLALSANIQSDTFLGNASTYIPARLGGHHGRALRDGDTITLTESSALPLETALENTTPERFRPHIGENIVLRSVGGPEAGMLSGGMEAFCAASWAASPRMDRMGIALDGSLNAPSRGASMASSAVFPGTVQWPAGGQPYLLGVDGQTSGGYPRIAHVIRADRHLIGQIRPGTHIQFVAVTPRQARELYRAKTSLWTEWLPGLELD